MASSERNHWRLFPGKNVKPAFSAYLLYCDLYESTALVVKIGVILVIVKRTCIVKVSLQLHVISAGLHDLKNRAEKLSRL